jgi:hypothetical protein
MQRQGCCHFGMTDRGIGIRIRIRIGKGKILGKSQFYEFGDDNICIELRLFQAINGFCCFQTSILWDCDGIRSNESIFPITPAFWFSFPLFLHPVVIFNVDSNYFLKNEAMIRIAEAHSNEFSASFSDTRKYAI